MARHVWHLVTGAKTASGDEVTDCCGERALFVPGLLTGVPGHMVDGREVCPAFRPAPARRVVLVWAGPDQMPKPPEVA